MTDNIILAIATGFCLGMIFFPLFSLFLKKESYPEKYLDIIDDRYRRSSFGSKHGA